MFGWSEAIPTLIGDFPCINTLWHQQELGSAANSPLPVPWKTRTGGQWCAETSCCFILVLNLCSWGCSHLVEHAAHLAWHIHIHLPRVLLDGSSSQGCFIFCYSVARDVMFGHLYSCKWVTGPDDAANYNQG